MNKEKCDEWLNFPTLNPLTRRKIKENGATYKKIEKECKKLTEPKQNGSLNTCDKWKKNKLKNPRTNRPIKLNGSVYKQLERECSDYHSDRNLNQNQITNSLCDRWLNDITINPKTNMPMIIGSPDFNQLIDYCKIGLDELPIPTIINFYKSRVIHENSVVNFINSLDISEWSMCMTGRYSKFRKSLSNAVLIGRGSFGEVYKANVNGLKFVVKEAYLTEKDNDKLIKYNVGRNKAGKFDKNSYPREFILLELVKDLIKKDKCPNFVYAYKVSICDSCKLNTSVQLGKKCYLTITEPADGDLYKFLIYNMISDAAMWSIIYQCLIAVYSMHAVYGIIHKDIKRDNFLIKIVKPGGCIKYIVENSVYSKTFYIENHGIIILLSDLGISESLHPTYTPEDFTGTRNAELVSVGDAVIFQPITCEFVCGNYRNTIVKPEFIYRNIWKNGEVSTRNKTFNSVPLELLRPNINIDVYDLVKFPAFEFFIDVLDVINMFIEGKRMYHGGTHSRLQNISNTVYNKLRSLPDRNNIFNYDQTNTWSIDAALMLEKIYNRPETETNIIAVFYP